jgi:hypothetical protein
MGFSLGDEPTVSSNYEFSVNAHAPILTPAFQAQGSRQRGPHQTIQGAAPLSRTESSPRIKSLFLRHPRVLRWTRAYRYFENPQHILRIPEGDS